MSKIKALLVAASAFLGVTMLTGCKDLVLIHSKGAVGLDERDLIIIATLLMLLVVVPVIIMTIVFAIRYRATNTKATYDPSFHHSNKIEVVIWGVPIIIIGILATIVWKTSHSLDPYRPLDSDVKPLEVQVVALDWKWLFIYPEQHIATVNYLEIPANTPISFKITAGDAPMNSFMIPQLGGQIYAMAGMQTQLHLIADEEGVYDGRGYGFSGEGFNGMHFKTHAVSQQEFDSWVEQTKSTATEDLSASAFDELEKPSEYVEPKFYRDVEPNLFSNIMMKFMGPMDSANASEHADASGTTSMPGMVMDNK